MKDTNPVPKRADEWRPVFLQMLRNTGNIRASANAAGVTRPTVYNHKRRSKEFAAAWDDAIQDAVDTLEAIAIDRARKGSDTLLIFLLKAHRPEKYRETVRTQHSGPNDEPVKFTLNIGNLGKENDDDKDDDG